MAKRKQKAAMTLDGQQVWSNGHFKYWIGERGNGFPATQLLFSREWDPEYLAKYTRKVEGQIGQPVILVDIADAEVSSI